MAARQMQTHISSLLFRTKGGPPRSWRFQPTTGIREIVTQPDPTTPSNQTTLEFPNNTTTSNVHYTASSSLKTSKNHDLAMVFTCKVCETRSVKMACRESYEKGVVVARCGGCNNLHLIADRLGWFGEPGSVEDYLAKRGEEVKKGGVDTLNLTLEDLVGMKGETQVSEN
ncbi:hypothetical protein GIB67_027577 [Kingdonia uniflora]|uniref:DNL-type domain-containing protein n=1 Tax=Kingdonia uniflora TaxID=39325 RepID=A0A7J7NKN3_9MAGN|nr:hypothetical protein GIB67_027577 [Kingdonia uniflora]